MSIEESIQRNKYFEYRNIDSKANDTLSVPLWIANELSNKNLKILDYGCGLGQIIETLKRQGYLHCYGVDIEINAIKHCISRGLDVKELDINNLHNPYGFKFDIIILSHIIEHISKDKIIITLNFIRKNFLLNGGKLLIAVPNAQSNTNAYWMYEDWTHSTMFTTGSLYYILKAAGFESVDFLDVDCTLGSTRIKKYIRKFLLKLYKKNLNFWNKVTCSSFHKQSPQIFSYEIKCKAW